MKAEFKIFTPPTILARLENNKIHIRHPVRILLARVTESTCVKELALPKSAGSGSFSLNSRRSWDAALGDSNGLPFPCPNRCR